MNEFVQRHASKVIGMLSGFDLPRAARADEGDGKLLEAIARGEWSINGFTNANLRPLLLGDEDANADVKERRRRAGMISRKLALLRAHGLIRRVNKTRRWTLTAAGRQTTTLLSIAKSESAQHLLEKAA